ncbi:hypothetical protein [Leifsonia sp. fls2-241-R2A-40a]|uniref:hypothetical protein n=1 Tax=Leifsonia sp. fls2-241-R2A-40a TaxID=3040290 RepID=UPI002550C9CF|nr:hypothetical protein [Leifsonia sp. fls2-241-R2A-40a]
MTFSPGASVDPEAAASLAHVMLESEIQARIAAVRELAKQRKTIHEALAAYEEGWNAAVKEGWTVEQLQQIGLKEAPFETSDDARPAVEAVAPYAAPVALSTDYRSDATPAPSYDTSSFGGPVAVPFNG